MMVTTVVAGKRSKKARAQIVTAKAERVVVFESYGVLYAEAYLEEETRRQRSHARVTLRLEDLRRFLADAEAVVAKGEVAKV